MALEARIRSNQYALQQEIKVFEIKVPVENLPCVEAFQFEEMDDVTLSNMEDYMKTVLNFNGEYSFVRWEHIDFFSKVVVQFPSEESAIYFILANEWLAK